MSSTSRESEPQQRSTHHHRAGDAFLAGLLSMLVINVGQRVIGLVRNLGFCQFLPEADLGLWALANSFFVIGAPLAVLGLPGSLGKFVEHYRLQGCLRPYLLRLTLVSACGVLLLCGLMLAFPTHSGQVLYGTEVGYQVIGWTVLALVHLILFNTVVELVTSLRLVRLASMMHLIQTAVFTILGIAVIWWTGNWVALLPAYSSASLAAIVPGLWGAWRSASHELKAATDLPPAVMWGRIVPFAVALWCSNLVSNLFDLSDRYMLLHLCPTDAQAGQALVGQFYCARILPNLLMSLGMMLSGILLPYLSANWERKQFDQISSKMNNLVIVISLGFTTLSCLTLAAAPLLFEWIFSNRFQPALSILPLGMALAAWSGMSTVAAAYLLCAEKAKQNAVLMSVALLLNIALNWPLILSMGLYGAALATAITNGLLVLMILWRVHREGCSISRKTIIFSLVPASLIFGAHVSAVTLLLLTVACVRTNWLLDQRDRESLDQLVLPCLRRVRLPIRSLWLPQSR
ncbi:MAG: lipopolysaccharide biosynthesis protein [Pirellulaceae bacterium]|nr:lipopolysaccharide biosynthesis protein [Pirellulaceae bacterium]